MYPITKLAIQREIEYIEKQLTDLPQLEELLKFTTKSFPIIAEDYKKKLTQLKEDLISYGALNSIKKAFAEVDNNDLKLIREYCEQEISPIKGTGINAIPTTDEYANGWNACRKEAYRMKNLVLQNILSIIDSDLKTNERTED